MKLENHFGHKPLYTIWPCLKNTLASDDPVSTTAPLIDEHRLILRVNGTPIYEFTCSPSQLAELCVGWLISEGHLSTPDDLLSLTISEDGQTADAEILPHPSTELKALSERKPDNVSAIISAMDCLQNEETVHGKTHGTHGCVLVDENGSLTLYEDIGRYNAIDKAIGSAVIQGRSMDQCMLCSSGRVPEDTVKKVIRSGIPILISKATATIQAVQYAREYHLTLCFFMRGKTFFCDHTYNSFGKEHMI